MRRECARSDEKGGMLKVVLHGPPTQTWRLDMVIGDVWGRAVGCGVRGKCFAESNDIGRSGSLTVVNQMEIVSRASNQAVPLCT